MSRTTYPSYSQETIFEYDFQIFDLKQMIDLKIEHKKQARRSIQAFKKWKHHYAQQTDMVELLYGSIEGIMLRRHAEESVRLYWRLRTDTRKAVQLYISRMAKNRYGTKAA